MRRLSAGLLLALAASPACRASDGAALWRFHARLDAATSQLHLAACSDRALAQVGFATGARAAPATLEVRRSGTAPLGGSGARREAQAWKRGECLLSRIDARDAARRSGSRSGREDSPTLVIDPRHWLWRPNELHPDSTIRFELPAGWSASVPWTPIAGEAPTYRLGPTAADWPALTAFGPFIEHVFERRGGRLRVAVLPPWHAREILRIEPVVEALLQAHGTLPREDAQVLVVPLHGQREAAPWGQVLRGGNAAVHLFVGADAGPDALIRDWTATHEFAHLLHPHLGARGRWLSEGLASYYQNVLRARTGTLTADDAWRRIGEGFERGRRETHTDGKTLVEVSRQVSSLRAYMRVYWSGAAFWLQADLALRARGSSLDAVLRSHAECCLDATMSLSPEAYMRALDRIAGAPLFSAPLASYSAGTSFPDVSALRQAMRDAPEVRADIMQPRAAGAGAARLSAPACPAALAGSSGDPSTRCRSPTG